MERMVLKGMRPGRFTWNLILSTYGKTVFLTKHPWFSHAFHVGLVLKGRARAFAPLETHLTLKSHPTRIGV